MDIPAFVESIINGAEQHGADTGESDHAIGDLQDALRIALELMTPEQRATYQSTPEVRTIVNGGIPPDEA